MNKVIIPNKSYLYSKIFLYVHQNNNYLNSFNWTYYKNVLYPQICTIKNYKFTEKKNSWCIEPCDFDLLKEIENFTLNHSVCIFQNKNSEWILTQIKHKRFLSSMYFDHNFLQDLMFFFSEEGYQFYFHNDIPWKKFYIIKGKAGTGKSSLIHSFASELNLNIYICENKEHISDLPPKSIVYLLNYDQSIGEYIDGLIAPQGVVYFYCTDKDIISSKADDIITLKPPSKTQLIHFCKKFFINNMYNVVDTLYESCNTINNLQKFILSSNHIEECTSFFRKFNNYNNNYFLC